MTGWQLREIREHLNLDELQYARLIGYTGTDRNDAMRIKRLERSELVPLYIARLSWMIIMYFEETSMLPEFPRWPGYEFDHTPDETQGEPDDAA